MSKENQILEALKRVKDPDLGRNIVELGFVKNLKIDRENVSFTIELTTPACPVKDRLKEEARQAVMSVDGIKNVQVEMTAKVRPTPSQQKENLLPQVKNIIPIASGKGGVGKSTVSANLALALVKMGAKVGLLDVDVYGPSIPLIMGVQKPPQILEGNRILPAEEHGVKIMSMGFFVHPKEAVVWRGPMLHKTVEQFLANVEWGELDYLIVDLPPGTGDVQLSLCQIIPLTGAAIVSTPQDVALQVAEKAIIMFQKLNTPVLGLIENMSGFVCRHCGEKEEIFGAGGVREYSLQHEIPFLGAIPLDTRVRETSDSGEPTVIADPNSPAAQAFMLVAQNLAAQVSVRNLGGAFGSWPTPKEITQPEVGKVKIVWKDGHESIYSAQKLRSACQCAVCVDEATGKQRLNPEKTPANIFPISTQPVGQYAINFQWSDGHATGIYAFEYLRALCPCEKCSSAKKVNTS